MDKPESTNHGAAAGLCASCALAREVPHPRGGAPYWRCGKHDEDPSFPKYPRLPVVACGAYRPKSGTC